MKTTWSYRYLIRRHGSPSGIRTWELRKRRELEEKTGTPWDSWTSRGKMVFAPYLPSSVPGAPDEDVAEIVSVVRRSGKRYGHVRMMTLIRASELLDWPLRRAVCAAKIAVVRGRASADVASTGRPVYLKVRRD